MHFKTWNWSDLLPCLDYTAVACKFVSVGSSVKLIVIVIWKIQLHTAQSLHFPWCRKWRTCEIGSQSKNLYCFYLLPPMQLILFARGLVIYSSFSTFPVNILSIIVEFIGCLKFLNNVSIFFRIILFSW